MPHSVLIHSVPRVDTVEKARCDKLPYYHAVHEAAVAIGVMRVCKDKDTRSKEQQQC